MRAQPRYIKDYVIPLPPLHEQRRIASRIEWLFAKLDDAEAELREVINSSEQRQAAILHKAFEGELTASWRNENHLSRDSWKRAIIKDVCRDVKVGIVIKPSQYYTDENDGTRAFRSANVREFRIEDSDWVYINDEGMSSNQRSVVHTGDVLIVRSGNPGTACVIDETFDGCNAIDILIAVPDKAIVTPDYLCAFTNSPAGKALVAQNKRGMALMHFNVKSYSALEIPLPTIEEQQVIVSKLFRMLDSERSVKGCAEVVLANIEMIRSSILAKALRGELGTNDPDEPSSKELLASVFEREA
jgi:type I restriction enzyme S subunit